MVVVPSPCVLPSSVWIPLAGRVFPRTYVLVPVALTLRWILPLVVTGPKQFSCLTEWLLCEQCLLVMMMRQNG